MASFLDRIRNGIKAFNSQGTNDSYNKFIYNWIGNNTLSNNTNDDDFIKRGYAYNPTIYSIINLISKAAITVPFQVYKKIDDGALKEYKALTGNGANEQSILKAKMMRKHTMIEVDYTSLDKV